MAHNGTKPVDWGLAPAGIQHNSTILQKDIQMKIITNMQYGLCNLEGPAVLQHSHIKR